MHAHGEHSFIPLHMHAHIFNQHHWHSALHPYAACAYRDANDAMFMVDKSIFFFIRSCTHTCILAHETLVHALKNCTVAFNPIPDLRTVASKLYNQRLPLTNVFFFSFFNGIFIILSMFNAFIYAFHIKKRFWRQMVCACPYFPTRLEAKGCTKFLFPM